MRLVFLLASSLFVSFVCSSSASAGVVKVSCDPGSCVSLFVYRMTPPNDAQQSQCDTNNDGLVEFGVANQATVKDLFVCKNSDGRRIWYEAKLVAGGATLVSLEPLSLPTFRGCGAGEEPMAIVSLEAFLGQGNPFTVGQTLTATAGAVPQTSFITFKNASGLPADPDWSVIDPSSFADYSGCLEVEPFDSVVPPSTVPVLPGWGMGVLAGLLLCVGVFVLRGRVG